MTSTRRVIGVDESGKGDFFGPLVVAALLASDDQKPALREMGVRDGKLIANKKLLSIDEHLRALYPHAVLIMSPREYNRRYTEIRNLNKLLAAAHARAISTVLSTEQADLAVSDKFGKPELVEDALKKQGTIIRLEQVVGGEAIAQVAAASILARAAFLREMARLSASVGEELPRGAGPVVDEIGCRLAARLPASAFTNIAKTHFKNFQRILKPRLFR